MPRSEKQKIKLCLIIEFFKRRSDAEHPVTISDVIDYLYEYGITAERKSIYRDICAMEELGYEIVQIRNRKYMYYLANREFEIAELRMLVDAVQASRFITKKKSNELIRKLESLTTEHNAKKLQSQVFVTNRIKASNESIYYNVDSIHMAIHENKRITFTYFDWEINHKRKYRHMGGEYEVSPWSLIWNNENYYLIAYDTATEMIRHYRVDRMSSITTIDEERLGKAEFKDVDIAKYAKRFFGMYNGELVRVKMNCRKDLANAVIDMFGADTYFDPCNGGESFNIEVDVAISPVFLSWVFMFGGGIKILSPASTANQLSEMAKKFVE